MKVCAIVGSVNRKELEAYKDGKFSSALKSRLYSRLESLILEENVGHFLCGMSAGPEMLASEAILELKKKYPRISLESVIPYEAQAARWNEELRDRYFNIAACCDRETMLQKHYSPDCLDRQDLYMIGKADIIISAWMQPTTRKDRDLSFAQKLGKRVIDITYQ